MNSRPGAVLRRQAGAALNRLPPEVLGIEEVALDKGEAGEAREGGQPRLELQHRLVGETRFGVAAEVGERVAFGTVSGCTRGLDRDCSLAELESGTEVVLGESNGRERHRPLVVVVWKQR